jgi:hypothetical protein
MFRLLSAAISDMTKIPARLGAVVLTVLGTSALPPSSWAVPITYDLFATSHVHTVTDFTIRFTDDAPFGVLSQSEVVSFTGASFESFFADSISTRTPFPTITITSDTTVSVAFVPGSAWVFCEGPLGACFASSGTNYDYRLASVPGPVTGPQAA